MKKGYIVLGVCLFLSAGVHVVQYHANETLQNDVNLYEESQVLLYDKIESLEMILSAEQKAEKKLENWYVQEIPELSLMAKAGNGDDVFQSDYFAATGAIAQLNGRAINANGGVTFLELYDAQIAKVSIEGYMPVWYLIQEEYSTSFQEEDGKVAYILADTDAYYGADVFSGFVTHFAVGSGVQILGSLDDWYYIKALDEYKYAYPNMWVKQEVVGDFKTLQKTLPEDTVNGVYVKISKGTRVLDGNWLSESGVDASTFLTEEDRIGEIKGEDEIYYYIGFPGTVLWAVEKEHVVFFDEG